MNNGLYPPSLQFQITYAYGMEDNNKRTPHTVSVTGCDEEDEVKFVVDVFEPPDTPGTHGSRLSLSLYVCACVHVCSYLYCYNIKRAADSKCNRYSITNTPHVCIHKGYICMWPHFSGRTNNRQQDSTPQDSRDNSFTSHVACLLACYCRGSLCSLKTHR